MGFLGAAVVLLFFLNAIVWQAVIIETGRQELSVHFLDVGQADATLIEAPNGNRMLIDAGAGREVLEPLFDHLPYYDRQIDVVIATHPHKDHIGGLVDVLEHFEVEVVLDSGVEYDSRTYRELQNYLDRSDTDKLYARRGMVVRLGEETIAPILFPNVNTQDMDADMASIWTQVIHGDNRFLFTGDAFSNIERFMAAWGGDELESEVFQAGHHGSDTSNSLQLLGVVQPEYVVVSAGKDNRYGHPHQEPLDNFAAVQAQVLKTYREGDVVFSSDGERVKLE